jgi:signal transduction histidine kinase
MRSSSLQLRLVAGGIVAILIALTVAGAGLVLLFERPVSRTIADDLDVHLKQLLAGIDVDGAGHLVLTRAPSDPRFGDPLSGLYWQVSDNRGELLRSRSLWDTKLSLPNDQPAPGEVHRHHTSGPGGAQLLVAERFVSLRVGDERIPVRAAAAVDLSRVSSAASAFAKDLSIALGLLACVLGLATWIQVSLGLRPLEVLRRGVADIRQGRTRYLPSAVPAEVRPLVEEVNSLIDVQEQEIERSRSRAADLAHGLKTPLAALATDAARLREHGEQQIAQDIESVSEAMSRQVDRELARARVRARWERPPSSSTLLAPLVRSLISTLLRTPEGQRVTFGMDIADDVCVPLDRVDLAEVLGNILENAARHATSRVRITTRSGPAGPAIVVEDDGEGIAPAQLEAALQRGVRLDEGGAGAGLGLAIVQDVLDAYNWRLKLDRSDLGGLKATLAAERRPHVEGKIESTAMRKAVSSTVGFDV